MTQAFPDPQGPQASMGFQVHGGLLDLLDKGEKMEHEVCPVRYIFSDSPDGGSMKIDTHLVPQGIKFILTQLELVANIGL